VTSKSSKLLHLDPLAIALERKRQREEESAVTASEPNVSNQPDVGSQPRLSSQPSEQPPAGPVSNQPDVGSQPRLSSQPTAANQKPPAPLNLLASVPDIKGEARIPHRYSDYLCRMLKPDEQAVYWQLYRLSWGWGKDTCFISNPKLSERSNVPLSSMKRAVAGLISKGLVEKTGQTNGYGKEQGVEYRLPKLDWQPIASNQPRLSSQPNVAPNKVKVIKENTQTPARPLADGEQGTRASVRVGSRFSLEECRRFAESLRGEGIQNPGGYATAIHRSGEADDQVEAFLTRQEGAREEKHALSAEQIQEQANVAASMLLHGSSIEEVEQLLAGNFRPAQWHMIRSVALTQAKLTGAPAKPRNSKG
jgi:helix-turn-helix protein